MSDSGQAGAVTLYCPQCGQAMTVAREHIQTTVGCPHCSAHIDAWRLAAAGEAQQSPSDGSGPQSPRPYAPSPQAPPPPPGQGFGAPPHRPPMQPYHQPPRQSSRNKVVAGVFGILLGGLGVHRFYLGYIGIGVLQIVVTLLTLPLCGGIGCLWGFVEGIVILAGGMRDADGLELRD